MADQLPGPLPAAEVAAPAATPIVGAGHDARWVKVIDDWLAQYKANTAAAYRRDLEAWVRWAVAHGHTLATADHGAVARWRSELEAAGQKPATIARKLATLSSFYRQVVFDGLLPRSPLDRVRRPSVDDESQTMGIDAAQAAALLAAADTCVPRDRALLCLLLLNGMRVSEACNAQIEDLDTIRGRTVLHVVRKGRAKPAAVPLADRTAAAVAAAAAGRDAGPLLLDWDGRPLDRFDARRICRRVGRMVGLPDLHPHALRHAFVTAALDAGVPLRDVQDSADHRDPRTTRRYDRARHQIDRNATFAVEQYLAGPPDTGRDAQCAGGARGGTRRADSST